MTETYTLKDASDKLGIPLSTLNDRANMMESIIYARVNGKRCFNDNELEVMSYVDEQMKNQSGKKDLKVACEKAKEIFYPGVNTEEEKHRLNVITNMTQEIIDSLK